MHFFSAIIYDLDSTEADGYDSETDTYYFDRHRPTFPAILHFYQHNNQPDEPIDTILENSTSKTIRPMQKPFHIWRPLNVPMEWGY